MARPRKVVDYAKLDSEGKTVKIEKDNGECDNDK